MTSDKRVCEICKFTDTNEFDLGKWRTSEDCTIHYFCALLSTNSVQLGDDEEGIDGFLVKDIRDLVKLHKKTKCVYCKKTFATVRCKHLGCQRYFHLVCGIKNGCLNQFEDPYPSYCHRHVQIEEKYEVHLNFWSCQICCDPMGDYNPLTSIPSCCNQGYYHKACIQKYALYTGYLTKCPSCGKDSDGYRKFIRQRGIFCPDKDADFELTQDAYASLLQVRNTCDATKCLCPKGRNYIKTSGKWILHRCHSCGSKCVHKHCRETDTVIFLCDDCTIKSQEMVENSQSMENINNSQKEHLNEAQANEVEVEGKVLTTADTNMLTFRKRILVLTDSNDDMKQHVDPLCDEERKKMRKLRMDLFFDRADFESKPPIPQWLI